MVTWRTVSAETLPAGSSAGTVAVSSRGHSYTAIMVFLTFFLEGTNVTQEGIDLINKLLFLKLVERRYLLELDV